MRARLFSKFESAAGFSLLELLLFTAGLVVLAAAAIPNFHWMREEWNLWGGMRLIEQSLQWGRMHAIASNLSLFLVVDSSGNKMHWADADTGEIFEESIRHLPSRVRISSSPGKSLRFFPQGNAAPAGTFVVQGSTGSYRIIVNIAGRIRVQKN